MASSLRFEIIKDLDKAREMWNMFTPRETIYDEWDFRYCFYKYFNYELFFYVGYVNDEPIGLLPLQWNPEKKHLEFFGGDYMEDNRVYMKKEHKAYIPEFYGQIDRRAELNYIRGEDGFTKQLTFKDNKFVLPLTGLASTKEYLSSYFQSETQRRMQQKVRHIEKVGVELSNNQPEDLEKLFEFNIDYFGAESAFVWRPHHKEIFRDLLKLPFRLYLMGFTVNGVKQGVSFALLSNKSYAYISIGLKMEREKDLNTYIHLKNIETALKTGAHTLDAFTGDFGWKDKWHFHKIPQYNFNLSI